MFNNDIASDKWLAIDPKAVRHRTGSMIAQQISCVVDLAKADDLDKMGDGEAAVYLDQRRRWQKARQERCITRKGGVAAQSSFHGIGFELVQTQSLLLPNLGIS